MVKVKINLVGRDAVLISTCYLLHSGLSTLPLYRNLPEKMLSLDQVKQKVDILQQAFEGGVNGDRVEIAKRNQARKEVIMMFKKIRDYLQSVATEEDIPALIQAGFEVWQPTFRGKKAIVPAA